MYAIRSYYDRIVITYKNSFEQAENIVNDINKTKATAKAIKCDVSDKYQVNCLVKEIISEFGEISVLINNAGIAHEGLFTDISENEWDDIFNVNVKGVFNCTQAVLPSMISIV